MDPALRRQVRQRARNRCEYCRISQEDDFLFSFHLEHILPRQHGGRDELENLAFACYHCNRHKGPNLATLDPETGQLTRVFNPREDNWIEHFEPIGAVIVGRTSIGRATVALFLMNAVSRVELREELVKTKRWP